jgi:hypothetical protein
MKYTPGVQSVMNLDTEKHESRRQRGVELAALWVDGQQGEVLKATKKSPQLLAATILSLIEADLWLNEATLLCERVMGIDKSDKDFNGG